ncbi:hypothetical protein ACF3OI_09790 (plasmid) [Finegoldia magna]|uniref:hypothetical protein n=1 Tax=Finegoldia magna TaxID=1260 RepID=UPI00370D1F63
MTTRIEKAIKNSVLKQDILNLQEEIVQLIYKTLKDRDVEKTLIDEVYCDGITYDIYLECLPETFYDETNGCDYIQQFTDVCIKQNNISIFSFNSVIGKLYSSEELTDDNTDIVLNILQELVKEL